MGMKEDYEKREGVKPLSDEEFEKLKAKADETRKYRWKPLLGTEEEFQKRLDMESLRREQYEHGPTFKPKGSTLFYHRITIPMEKVWAFFGFGKKE